MFCEIFLNTYGLDPVLFHFDQGFSLIAAQTMTKSQTTFINKYWYVFSYCNRN